MKKLIFAFVFILFTAACSSPKMTKLETELDKIISKYDTSFWKNKKNKEKFNNDIGLKVFSNDTLLKELKVWYKTFISIPANFEDLNFCYCVNDLEKFEINNKHKLFTADTCQFFKYKIHLPIFIDSASRKCKLIGKNNIRLLDDTLDFFEIDLYNGKIEIFFPCLEIEHRI